MNIPILTTKLYIPLPRTNIVLRPRLIERLNSGLDRKLTLISASAGFGKTTLVTEWIANCERPVAWLSLDEGDDNSIRHVNAMLTVQTQIVMTKFYVRKKTNINTYAAVHMSAECTHVTATS